MEITAKTKLLGLLGWPVSHSKSPLMQRAAALAAGLDFVYVALPVHPDGVGAAVRGLPALGFVGANVTVPHKQAIIPFLDELAPSADALGAANTIVIKNEGLGYQPRLIGHNTDASGFLADLKSYGVQVGGRDCVVLGGGGSARAVAYALAQDGARVHLCTRRSEQGQAVLAALDPFVPSGSLLLHNLESAPEVASGVREPLLINCTPLGMTPQVDGSVWRDSWPFPKGAFIYDLVYNPAETRLVRQAQAAGCRAVSGLGMLVHQGAEAFYLWTGVRPDVVVMRRALTKS